MKPILSNSIIFIGCEIFSKAVPFLLLPYFTRVLVPAEFGALGLFTSLQVFFIILVSLSFDGAIARYYYRYGKRNFDALFYHALFFIITLAVIVWGILTLTVWDNKITQYALITAALQSVFNVILTSKQCQKKASQYAFYQISFAVLSAFTTVVLFNFFEYNVRERIYSLIISFTIIIIIFYAFNKKPYHKIFNFKLAKLNVLYLFSFGFPLIMHQLSLYIKGQFDRILIAHSFSLSELAQYTAAFQLASCLNVIIMALNKALVPYYFEVCKNKKLTGGKAKKWFLLSIPVSILPGLIMFTLPESFYGFILGPEYSKINHITALFVVGFSMQIPYLLAVNYMFYHNENKRVAIVTFTASLIHLTALFYFKEAGIHYLPFALIISNLSCLVLLYFIGLKHHAKRI